MKKIGKEVLWLGCSETNPRNGEGAFLRMKDGSVVYLFTEYVGETWSDHANARITKVVSYDEGETWSERSVLLEKPAGSKNIMSLTLLRMANGDVGLFYILKHADGTDSIILLRSADEMQSWSEPVDCTAPLEKSYYVLNNDRVIRTAAGRLLMPLGKHAIVGEKHAPGTVCFVYSDDDGKTWKASSQELCAPVIYQNKGFEEPGLFELDDGTVWCYVRTNLLCQYESFSSDGGETWSQPLPNPFFSSPRAPMLVKKLGGKILAVFNPAPNYTTRVTSDSGSIRGRTPFVIAVSDDGKAWDETRVFAVEDDPEDGFCYPAMLETKDGILLAYYHSGGSHHCLHCSRITKILFSELQTEE